MSIPNFDAPTVQRGHADFSSDAVGSTFTADGDEFSLVSELPGMAHLEVTNKINRIGDLIRTDPEEAAAAVTTVIELLLTPDSASHFISRMRGGSKPISLARALRVVAWAVEEITGRPTQPDEPSLSG